MVEVLATRQEITFEEPKKEVKEKEKKVTKKRIIKKEKKIKKVVSSEEAKYESDKRLVKENPGFSREAYSQILKINPENYILIKLELEGIQFLKELLKNTYNWTWAEVKEKYDFKKFDINVTDAKEIWTRIKKDKIEKEKEEAQEELKYNRERRIHDKSDTELQKNILMKLTLKQREEASELIVNEIMSNNYIYTIRDDIKEEMYIYQNGVYLKNGMSYIREICRDLLGEAYTQQISNDVINKIQADTFIEQDTFFKTRYVDEVPVLNGILNVYTRELKPFDPKKIFLNKLPIEYNKEAKCPAITQFFKDVLREESDAQVMFELFGYSLLKEYKFEKAFMFIGNGRNGKGKTLSLLKKFVGAEHCGSIPLSQITASSTIVWSLHNKMVNIAGDLSKTDLKDTGMFKQITGRDLITADRKYLNALSFVNYAKLIFACNDLPKVYDLSDGFWSRWILMQFPYKFVSQKEYKLLPKKDKELHKIRDEEIIDRISIPEEMSGLLNEALNGLDRLLLKRDFSYSKGTQAVKDLWIRQSDSFTAFCFDMVVENPETKVSKKELRKAFHRYCKRHNIKGCGDKAIKATLEDNYGVIESQIYGTGERVWEGIILKNLEELPK